jgi:predicted small metal-binding protein
MLSDERVVIRHCATTMRGAMKEFSCEDVVPGCTASFRAPSEEALMQEIARHARDDHGLAELTPDLLAALKECIRTAGCA